MQQFELLIHSTFTFIILFIAICLFQVYYPPLTFYFTDENSAPNTLILLFGKFMLSRGSYRQTCPYA
jgi:hypothetical protein